MDPLYWLRQPDGAPASPRRWSYTALSAWRMCPRRWWLQHAHYDNAPEGKYPAVFGVSAIHGRLVHAALETWRKALRRNADSPRFNVRQFIKQAFRELLAGEVGKNPRINRGRIEAAFSLDECVRQVFALSVGLGEVSVTTVRHESGEGGSPSDAEELWVEVEDPPLCGRIDQVRSKTLVDFKTSEPDLEGHGEQVLFYAALWWLRYGELPTGMEIRYPDEAFSLPAPSDPELTAGVESLRLEVGAINAALAAPPPPAKPAIETCRYCPVRQLCGEYWSSASTQSLRGLPIVTAGSEEGTPPFRDIRLTTFPAHWEPGKALNGTAGLDGGGSVELRIPSTQCPPAGAGQPVGLMVLNALLTNSDEGWKARLTSASEVFWAEITPD